MMFLWIAFQCVLCYFFSLPYKDKIISTLSSVFFVQKSVFTVQQLFCLFSLLDDPTVQGLDKSRHLQTGEMIIIVVVLLMWAGRFVDCVFTNI